MPITMIIDKLLFYCNVEHKRENYWHMQYKQASDTRSKSPSTAEYDLCHLKYSRTSKSNQWFQNSEWALPRRVADWGSGAAACVPSLVKVVVRQTFTYINIQQVYTTSVYLICWLNQTVKQSSEAVKHLIPLPDDQESHPLILAVSGLP